MDGAYLGTTGHGQRDLGTASGCADVGRSARFGGRLYSALAGMWGSLHLGRLR